jgi:ABC-type sulfate/molybdate transport systems ATPase subunit/ABC-type sulfate transport system permease component
MRASPPATRSAGRGSGRRRRWGRRRASDPARRGWVRRRGPLPLLGALLALYLLAPIAVLLAHLGESARGGLPTGGLAAALEVSLLTASISTAIIALLGIPLAWRLAHGASRLWEAVGVAVQVPLALPPLMSGILLIEVVGPQTLIGRLTGGGLSDTTAAIVVAQTFVAAPFLVVAARSAFAAVDPSLNEVAATLGHGSLARFWRVSLPVAGPGIRAGLLLSWLRAFGEFGATVILAYHPYSLPVFTFVQFTSTGLPSALPPTGAAVAAAVIVLTLARVRPLAWALARWRASHPVSAPCAEPAAIEDRIEAPGPLAFELHDRLGAFELSLAHRGAAAHLAVLGPSGAGKSLTLRCLAGLRGSGVGEVRIGGERLGHLPAERRRVGWVPQDAALLPGRTVWQQVTFGAGAAPARAAAWLARLGLADLHDRRPEQLSGGQRKRVGLARALAIEPRLLLLDEPFSGLDRPVRDELRRELRRLQRETGIASVLVTHDPEEAALLADEVIVLADGRALQAGPRARVFSRPASARVARLLAIENLRSGELLAGDLLRSGGSELAICANGLRRGTRVSWCVRSEHVRLAPPDSGSGRPATVLDVLDLGAWREVLVRLDGGLELTARTLDAGGLAPGGACRALIAPEAVTFWSEPAPG